MDTRTIYESWLNEPTLDESTRAELRAISADAPEIEERFYRELEFGTAGLRGILGAGTNRMNVYVVRRATQGLSNVLLSCKGAKERGVCIAYDSRLFSPGEYFKLNGKMVADYAANITQPVFITSAKSEGKAWRGIADSITSDGRVFFLPESSGRHGSSALYDSARGHEEYWAAVEAFLASLKQ